MPARKRSHYVPSDRLQIIQLMRLRAWSLDEAAARFAIHENTIRAWIKELETHPDSTLFIGVTPHNNFGGAVQELVQRIRQLCPQREFGTRAIAMAILRALKVWQRVKLLTYKITSIQRRLDIYRDWYNSKRPMKVLDARTPEEAWTGTAVPTGVPIFARDPQPEICVTRKRYRDDPHLFVLDIQIKRSA